MRCATAVLALLALAGCSRTHYRMQADAEAYAIIGQKTADRPWTPPNGYSLMPDPRSRLFDPSPIDDPQLPCPAPQLYAYQLPPLPPRDPSRFNPGARSPAAGAGVERPDQDPVLQRLPPVELSTTTASPAETAAAEHVARQRFPGHQQSYEQPVGRPLPEGGPAAAAPAAGQPAGPQPAQPKAQQEVEGVRVVPVEPGAWKTVPSSCLRRMLEFQSVRDEYQRSFQRPPGAELRDQAQRLSLEDIVELASLNSREYQTEKETLYRAALRLSLERLDFELKFSTGNNRTSVNFDHSRNGGITTNNLRVPTTSQADKVLATGGDLLARFANNVVLTFNGPQGFAADISSELLFELSQNIFQRDIRLEDLTQAERDVVYAARDFARFRKELFDDLASEYYSLIRTYRQVEIDSQNYFTLVRAFAQGEAEYQAGFLPRFQLDQIEQDMIRGRSRLITTCNNLERSLDNLKIRIGLPTETPINIDLTELEQITRRDELAVAAELIRRVRRRLIRERQAARPQRAVLLSAGIVMIDRILDAFRLQKELGRPLGTTEKLEDLHAQMRVDEGRLEVARSQADLDEELHGESPTLTIIFQRRVDLIERLLDLIGRQIDLAGRRQVAAEQIAQLRTQLDQLHRQLERLREGLTRLVQAERLEDLKRLDSEAQDLQKTAQQLIETIDKLTGQAAEKRTAEQRMQRTLEQVDFLLRESNRVLQTIDSGLVPIKMDVDDAMLTALVQRFDLMNQRGQVADSWRQIKLAADDLKSILNLQATQTLRTPDNVNRPFAFSFKDSQTRLNLTFDAPLNRWAQRNAFRESLINYQATLRRLMQLEDNIKLAVRNDLRNLDLEREQYVIDVASAALAFERVVSTRLQLRLGIQGVEARDFLEAQNAYTSALSSVAGRHINYIVDRTKLFLDLELLTVDDNGFWPDLYREELQPQPSWQLPDYALPAYGTLPCGVLHSHKIRRMLQVPTGTSMIHGRDEKQAPQPHAAAADSRGSRQDSAAAPALKRLPPP